MKAGLPDWTRKRFDPTQRYGLRVTLFALATMLVLVPFSYLTIQVLSQGPLTRIDENLAERIHEIVRNSPVLIGAATFVSWLGTPLFFYVAIGAAALFFWRREDKRLAIFLVVTNMLGGAIDTVVKIMVDRPRPSFEDPIAHAFGKSFPSGHVMATTVGYGTLLLAFMPFIPRRWRPWAIAGYGVMIVLMALSRLGLGVHFLSDVMGGAVLGLAWLAVGTAAFSIWRREQRKKPVEVLEGAEPEVARTA